MQLIITEYSKEIKFVQNKESMKLESDNKFNSPEETLNSVISFIKKLLFIYKIDV